MKTLKLGTRRSALAWAQSSWVAREIEKKNPGIKVELVGIETQGDRIVDIPLRQVEGKEFFSAEIDQALLRGDVQLTVHSLKDLSLERPKGLRLAATPKRADPRDVILFGPRTAEKLAQHRPLKIGTSAPRRLENLPIFLQKALPHGREVKFDWIEIRGNVDTRLRRLLEAEGSEKFLDGVVLSLAGLTRLWMDHEEFSSGHKKLEQLLRGMRWLVLPLSQCPTAPGQGSLAIECREDDQVSYDAIHRLHDSASFDQIATERAVLGEFGGGCHQRFGATQVSLPECGDALWIKGRAMDGKVLDEFRWKARPIPVSGSVIAWDGTQAKCFNQRFLKDAQALKSGLLSDAVFIAHSRALPDGAASLLGASRVWTSGTRSWFTLAEKGVWVEGCAEGLGFESIRPLLKEAVLQLPAISKWRVLTHKDAEESWNEAQVVATYSLEPRKEAVEGFSRQTTHVFWNSGSQFLFLGANVPATAQHSCGPGKTAQLLREKGIRNLTVFPSVKEWRKWLKIPDVE